MLTKTTDFLRKMLREQRHLEMMADARGVQVDRDVKMKENDYGGKEWTAVYMEEYRAQKAKKAGSGN